MRLRPSPSPRRRGPHLVVRLRLLIHAFRSYADARNQRRRDHFKVVDDVSVGETFHASCPTKLLGVKKLEWTLDLFLQSSDDERKRTELFPQLLEKSDSEKQWSERTKPRCTRRKQEIRRKAYPGTNSLSTSLDLLYTHGRTYACMHKQKRNHTHTHKRKNTQRKKIVTPCQLSETLPAVFAE